MFFRLTKWLHRRGLSRRKMKGTWVHRRFGDAILKKELWSFRSEPVARAWLIGMIVTTVPLIPGQSLIAILLAIYFGANLPVAILLQFLSCPPTAPVHLPLCFFVGSLVLGDTPPEVFAKAGEAFANGIFSMESMNYVINRGFFPLYLGSLIVGPILGLIGYFTTKLLWKEPPKAAVAPKPMGVPVEAAGGKNKGL